MRRRTAARKGTSRYARHPFDLEGTLLDTNYKHVLAWRLALRHESVEIPDAFLHRCNRMRGELLIRAAFKESAEHFEIAQESALKDCKTGISKRRCLHQPTSRCRRSPESLVTSEHFLGHSDRRRQAHRAEDDPAPSRIRSHPSHYSGPCRTC
jgi:hypothetical protein